MIRQAQSGGSLNLDASIWAIREREKPRPRPPEPPTPPHPKALAWWETLASDERDAAFDEFASPGRAMTSSSGTKWRSSRPRPGPGGEFRTRGRGNLPERHKGRAWYSRPGTYWSMPRTRSGTGSAGRRRTGTMRRCWPSHAVQRSGAVAGETGVIGCRKAVPQERSGKTVRNAPPEAAGTQSQRHGQGRLSPASWPSRFLSACRGADSCWCPSTR